MEIMHSSAEEIESLNDSKKCCSICKTTKTPLWRSGPTGPKSVCNACGIKYRKRRRENPVKGHGRKKQKPASGVAAEGDVGHSNDNGCKAKEGKMGKAESGKVLKVRLAVLGKEVVPLQRRREVGEVERAAAALIALSCGCVFA